MKKTPIITIIRDERSGYQCLGTCHVQIKDLFKFKSDSIERGDNNNQARISCIPEGEYELILEYSNRFKKNLWEIKGVPNRSECKFHSANYSYQLNGCIALGQNRKDINEDGHKDVTSSKYTMNKFHKSLKGHKKAILKVINL